jgi:HK97 gp10 family phage protein
MKSRLDLKGFDEYLAKVAQAGADIDAVTDEALGVGGKILVDGMLSRAPELTGELKRHIQMTQPAADGNNHFVKVGIYDVQRERQTYFFYQEMGTASTAAHPYIRPTFDIDMRRARAEMRKVFGTKHLL